MVETAVERSAVDSTRFLKWCGRLLLLTCVVVIMTFVVWLPQLVATGVLGAPWTAPFQVAPLPLGVGAYVPVALACWPSALPGSRYLAPIGVGAQAVLLAFCQASSQAPMSVLQATGQIAAVLMLVTAASLIGLSYRVSATGNYAWRRIVVLLGGVIGAAVSSAWISGQVLSLVPWILAVAVLLRRTSSAWRGFGAVRFSRLGGAIVVGAVAGAVLVGAVALVGG